MAHLRQEFAKRCGAVALVALLLAACSGDEEPKAQSGAAKDEHVWKGQVQAIDRARDVGNTLGAAAARQNKAAQQQ